MSAKAISRQVNALCSIRQCLLFAEAVVTNADEVNTKPASAMSPIRFETPGPRNLSITGKPLEAHLQLAGLTTPLKLRPLLTILSFSEFEASVIIEFQAALVCLPGHHREHLQKALISSSPPDSKSLSVFFSSLQY